GEALRIDVLEPDEDALDAAARALLDEVRQLVAERIDLDDDAELEPFLLAQLDQAIEDRLPILVAGEIVVGNEEAIEALLQVGAHQQFDVVRVAPARVATLHIDDGAERALVGTAAPGIEAGDRAGGALDALARE